MAGNYFTTQEKLRIMFDSRTIMTRTRSDYRNIFVLFQKLQKYKCFQAINEALRAESYRIGKLKLKDV